MGSYQEGPGGWGVACALLTSTAAASMLAQAARSFLDQCQLLSSCQLCGCCWDASEGSLTATPALAELSHSWQR